MKKDRISITSGKVCFKCHVVNGIIDLEISELSSLATYLNMNALAMTPSGT